MDIRTCYQLITKINSFPLNLHSCKCRLSYFAQKLLCHTYRGCGLNDCDFLICSDWKVCSSNMIFIVTTVDCGRSPATSYCFYSQLTFVRQFLLRDLCFMRGVGANLHALVPTIALLTKLSILNSLPTHASLSPLRLKFFLGNSLVKKNCVVSQTRIQNL